MFGMGMPEIMLIMAVALVVIGPKKLPGLAKSIGRAMGEFKSATRDFKRSIDVDGDLQDVKDSMDNLKDIPTYDPDQSAYERTDATRPTDDAEAETEQNSTPVETTDEAKAEAETTDEAKAQAETADTVKSSADTEADEPPSPGAKSHG
jgi:sec-independent protein translocase protein TatB